MKSFFAFVALLSLPFVATLSHAQNAFEQGKAIGFAGILLESNVTPITIGVEYGASDAFGIGGRLLFITGSGYYSSSATGLQAFGNYHLAQAFNVSDNKFDPYVGASLGKFFEEYSPIFVSLQLGTRYLINERVGPYAQLGIGLVNSRGTSFEIGVAYKFGQ